MDEHEFRFRSKLWLWQGDAAWHFLTLPKTVSARIRFVAARPKAGFGSVRVQATIGATTFRTSVFPSKSHESFLLPVKADVRNREGLKVGSNVSALLKLL